MSDDSKTEQLREFFNPATNQLVDTWHLTPLDEVPRLYEQARMAFHSWSAIPLTERLGMMRQLRLYLVEHLDATADAVAQSTGKVPVEALTSDVLPLIDAILHMEKHAKRALRKRRAPTPLVLFGKRSYIEYKPRGVVLCISPWNYPLQLSLIPVLSALVAGNTVILKPSEVTPLIGKLIERLRDAAGIPKDVLQIAHGAGDLGAALTKGNPDFIFFTGSVRTGKLIQAEAAKQLIPTTLELGGKDPMIVFSDANLERAVQGAIWGAFTNSGQVCMSVERLYVERPIYDRFVQRLVEETKRLRQGTGPDADIGSMTAKMQVDVVREQVREALDKGARLLTGSPPDEWQTDQGLFITPMVLVDVTPEMSIMQEETFGPVLPVIPFDTEDEVVQLANDSPYGLNASVWSKSLARARRVASRLVSGNVVINDVIITVVNHHLPFGGAKQSGLGKYHGEVGLRSFCVETAVMKDSGRQVREVAWYPYAGRYEPLAKLIKSFYGTKTDWVGFIKAYTNLLKGRK